MTSRRQLGSAAAAAAIATLAFPGAAGAAAGNRSFTQTFPVASRLCTNVSQGKGPKRLRHSAAQVLTDCSVLQSSFNAARASVVATDAALASQRASARAALTVACTGPAAHRRACEKAHKQDHKLLTQLGRQRIRAAHLYYSTVEGSRLAFWSAIRVLPGGKDLREDSRIRVQDS